MRSSLSSRALRSAFSAQNEKPACPLSSLRAADPEKRRVEGDKKSSRPLFPSLLFPSLDISRKSLRGGSVPISLPRLCHFRS